MFTRKELLHHYETMVKIRKFELEAKRAEKKRKKTVTVTDAVTGEAVEKVVSEAELAKLRLAKARALQEEKFRKMEEESRAAAEAAKAAKENAQPEADK